MAGTAFSAANWSGYDERPTTNPSSALTDFSLLIDISRMSASWKAAIQSNGADIRLTKGDNTELPFDLINFAYNSGAPTGLIRVKYTGTLASSGTQNVRVWAGYTGGTAVAYDATDTYGSDNAYDSSTKGYWPDGGSTDRTANGNDLTPVSVTAGGASGKIGVGTSYDGTDADYSRRTGFAVGGSTMRVGCWIRLISAETFGRIVTQGGNASSFGWLLAQSATVAGRPRFSMLASGGTAAAEDSTALPTDGTFVRLDGTYDGTTVRLYRNGSQVATATTSGTIGTPTDLTLASDNDPAPAGGDSSNCILNEVVVDTAARSADWIAEEYAQSNDQSAFWGTWAWTSTVTGITIPIAAYHYNHHLKV